MTDPRDALLADCARFIGAIGFLYGSLPERYRAAHLEARANDLTRRLKPYRDSARKEG